MSNNDNLAKNSSSAPFFARYLEGDNFLQKYRKKKWMKFKEVSAEMHFLQKA